MILWRTGKKLIIDWRLAVLTAMVIRHVHATIHPWNTLFSSARFFDFRSSMRSRLAFSHIAELATSVSSVRKRIYLTIMINNHTFDHGKHAL